MVFFDTWPVEENEREDGIDHCRQGADETGDLHGDADGIDEGSIRTGDSIAKGLVSGYDDQGNQDEGDDLEADRQEGILVGKADTPTSIEEHGEAAGQKHRC